MHYPTLLWTCITMLALMAGLMTLFGIGQRIYRGFWWWTAAEWFLVLGLVLQACHALYPALVPLTSLLVLQWPVVVLAGMRRFSSRQGLGVPISADWLMLFGAYLVWLAAWASRSDLANRVAAFAAGSMVLHLYAALLTTQLREFRQSAALKALVAIETLVAVVQGLRVAAASVGDASPVSTDVEMAAGLVVLVTALVMACLGLLLTAERTEHILRASHRKLRYLADIDVLTRVPNRRHFHELAARTLSNGTQGSATVMMFDIDHFKRVNDLLGHATGDEALRQVALSLRETLRTQDVAGRLGGDEFAVLLPHTSIDEAMSVAARIVAALEHRQVAPQIVPLSLSFGMVQMHAEEDIHAALRRADQALYEAKRQGRSRAVIATGEEARPVFGESQRLGLDAAA